MGNDSLPTGWAWASLGDIVDVFRQHVTPSKEPSKLFNYLSIENIESTTGVLVGFTPTLGRDIHSAKLIFTTEDILYSRLRPYLNKVHTPTFDGISATDLLPLRPKKGISREYVANFLRSRSVVEYASQRMRGIQLPRLTVRDLLSLRVPVAPSGEQTRIAAQINRLFSEIISARNALSKSQVVMQQFRRSVLTKAFLGELTEREQKDELVDQSSRNLRGKNATITSPGLTPTAGLPLGWVLSKVGDIGTVSSGYTPNKEYLADEGEIPFYHVSDMNLPGNEIFMVKSRTYLGNTNLGRPGIHLWSEGTVIFPKRGGAIATNKKRILSSLSVCDLNIMGVTLRGVLPRYFFYWLQTIDLGRLSDGSNVPQINHGDISRLTIPVAPPEEQLRIVSTVESILSQSQQINAVIGTVGRQIETLSESVLANAYSGRLVPQDAREEPASTLLGSDPS